MNKRQRKKRAIKNRHSQNYVEIDNYLKYMAEATNLKVKKKMKAVLRGEQTYEDFFRMFGHQGHVTITGSRIEIATYLPSTIKDITLNLNFGEYYYKAPEEAGLFI